MRILTLCDVLFPETVGGAGRVAREVAEGLVQQGEEVEFLARGTPGGKPPGTIFTTYFQQGRQRKVFQQVVRRFNPQLVHIHQPLPAYLAIPASFDRPLVYTFHSSWPEEFKIKASPVPELLRRLVLPAYRYVERSVLQRSNQITVLSKFSLNEVERLYDRTPVLIPGGVDTNRFQPPSGVSPQAGRLITLRNLVPRMGLHELVRAMKVLPESFTLEIGGEGPLKSSLESLIYRLRLEDRVRLRGRIPEEELPAFYASGQWFVLPTRELEGFGLVILESLACGTPVLGTRVGAIPELLERFHEEWLIDTPSSRSIAETIHAASKGPRPDPWDLHHKVQKLFGWPQITGRYRHLFRRVLREGS